MPAKSKKQQQFMAICSHTPGKSKGKCPPLKVAKEFDHLSDTSRNKLKSFGR